MATQSAQSIFRAGKCNHILAKEQRRDSKTQSALGYLEDVSIEYILKKQGGQQRDKIGRRYIQGCHHIRPMIRGKAVVRHNQHNILQQ